MATEERPIDTRAAIRANVEQASTFDVAYVTMNALAAVVASYGLFEDSPAVVIGAMIIAMLLGPIAGVSMGLVDRSNPLLRKALPTLVGGLVVVYATAFVLGTVHRASPLTHEIYARTTPNLMDLMIALAGGAAGAYAMICPRLNVAFVGVAIATALVPPLSSSAICLARGDYGLAWGAFLLTVTNIVGIQVAGSAVMWIGGYRGAPGGRSIGVLRRNVVSVAVLGALGVVLAANLRQDISKEAYQASVRRVLAAAAAMHEGAYLAQVRFHDDRGQGVVVAVYRTPVAFTPDEVGALEAQLPTTPGASPPELRVRSSPVTIATKAGYLFSGADLSDEGQVR